VRPIASSATWAPIRFGTMADLTVLSANLHNEPEAVQALRSIPFKAGLVAEAHRRGSDLRGLKRYRYLTGPQRGPSQEVGILVDRDIMLRGFSSTFLSRAAARFSSVGKERWGHDVILDLEPDVALIVAHPVAGPAALNGNDPSHPLVKRYAKAVQWIDDAIVDHLNAGREVVFGGDVQLRSGNDKPWSVYRVFERHGLDFYADGIDVIAWSSGLVKVRGTSHDIGSDHPALRVELNFNRNKRRK
jgi:hypothetical protein